MLSSGRALLSAGSAAALVERRVDITIVKNKINDV